MGKHKKRRTNYNEKPVKVKAPNHRKGEMFARVINILGQDRVEVYCEDGERRIGRIRGKIRKRVWIRQGDLVLINPWDFETKMEGEKEKCEVFWRYYRNQIDWLKKRNLYPEALNLNNIPVY